MKLQPLWGQVYGLNTFQTPTVERLLGMKPKVDCDLDLMKLTIHGREAPFESNFLIDRGLFLRCVNFLWLQLCNSPSKIIVSVIIKLSF